MQLEHNNNNENITPKKDLGEVDNTSFENNRSKLFSIKKEEQNEMLTEKLNQKDFDGNNMINNEDKVKIQDMLKEGGLTTYGALTLVIEMTDENKTLAQVYEKTFEENEKRFLTPKKLHNLSYTKN